MTQAKWRARAARKPPDAGLRLLSVGVVRLVQVRRGALREQGQVVGSLSSVSSSQAALPFLRPGRTDPIRPIEAVKPVRGPTVSTRSEVAMASAMQFAFDIKASISANAAKSPAHETRSGDISAFDGSGQSAKQARGAPAPTLADTGTARSPKASATVGPSSGVRPASHFIAAGDGHATIETDRPIAIHRYSEDGTQRLSVDDAMVSRHDDGTATVAFGNDSITVRFTGGMASGEIVAGVDRGALTLRAA